MKVHKKIALCVTLLLAAHPCYGWGWHPFRAVSHWVGNAGKKVVHYVAHPKQTFHQILHTAEDGAKDFAKDVKGLAKHWNPVALDHDVKNEKAGIKALKEHAPGLISQLEQDLNYLKKLIESKHTQENLKVVENAVHIKPPSFPSNFSASNFESINIEKFMNGINHSYKELQRPIEALFNLMTISYQAFAVMSDATVTFGSLCDYGSGVLTPLPLTDPKKLGNALKNISNTLQHNVPTAFTNMSHTTAHMKDGMNNIYHNIGQAIHALQERAVALQHILNLMKMLTGGKSSGESLVPPPPAVPAQIPAPSPPASFGPPAGPDGNPAPPPPPPPLPAS